MFRSREQAASMIGGTDSTQDDPGPNYREIGQSEEWSQTTDAIQVYRLSCRSKALRIPNFLFLFMSAANAPRSVYEPL